MSCAIKLCQQTMNFAFSSTQESKDNKTLTKLDDKVYGAGPKNVTKWTPKLLFLFREREYLHNPWKKFVASSKYRGKISIGDNVVPSTLKIEKLSLYKQNSDNFSANTLFILF